MRGNAQRTPALGYGTDTANPPRPSARSRAPALPTVLLRPSPAAAAPPSGQRSGAERAALPNGAIRRFQAWTPGPRRDPDHPQGGPCPARSAPRGRRHRAATSGQRDAPRKGTAAPARASRRARSRLPPRGPRPASPRRGPGDATGPRRAGSAKPGRAAPRPGPAATCRPLRSGTALGRPEPACAAPPRRATAPEGRPGAARGAGGARPRGSGRARQPPQGGGAFAAALGGPRGEGRWRRPGGGRCRVRPAQGARRAWRRPRRGPLRACPRGAAGPFCPTPRSRPFRAAARATRRQKLELLGRSKAQRHPEVSSPELDKRPRKRDRSELGPNLQPALRKPSCKSLSTWRYEHTHFDRLPLTHSRLAATASSDCLLLRSPVLRKVYLISILLCG